MRKGVEESLGHVLKDLNLSKQNTKEKQAFFNSLAKVRFSPLNVLWSPCQFIQIVKQLPAESPIKTKIHQIVFNQETGLFTTKNKDIRIFGYVD